MNWRTFIMCLMVIIVRTYLVQYFNTYSNKHSTSYYYYSINHTNNVYQKNNWETIDSRNEYIMLFMHNKCTSSLILITNYYYHYYYYYSHMVVIVMISTWVQYFNTYSNKYSTSYYYYTINHINIIYQKKQQINRGQDPIIIESRLYYVVHA